MTKTKDQQAQEYAEKKTAAAFDYILPNIDTAENLKIPVFTGEQIKQAYLDGYTAAEQSMWRSVEDEEPPIGKLILCRDTDRVALAYFDGEAISEVVFPNEDVMMPFWMPIPLAARNKNTIRMKNLPERIYLNIGDEVPADVDFRELSEVTWSEEKMFDNDIAFTRKPQWISVDEELPEDDETVLTYSSYGHVLAYYSEQDKMWFAYGNYGDINPTHWMPMPPIPDTNTEKI